MFYQIQLCPRRVAPRNTRGIPCANLNCNKPNQRNLVMTTLTGPGSSSLTMSCTNRKDHKGLFSCCHQLVLVAALNHEPYQRKQKNFSQFSV